MKLSFSFVLLVLFSSGELQAQKKKTKNDVAIAAPAVKWSSAKAAEWYRTLPWISGANYLPSTAINQLEMWQAETFDTTTIAKEFGWAKGIGFNTMRVYLHSLTSVREVIRGPLPKLHPSRLTIPRAAAAN